MVYDLQSQLTQARNTTGLQQPSAEGIAEMEFNLKQANSTLKEATTNRENLQFELVSATADLREAEADMTSAQRSLYFYSDLAPRMNTAAGFAAEHWPVVGIGGSALDVMSNPTYRSQTAEGSFRLTGLAMDLVSFAGGEAFWAQSVGSLAAFRNTLHDADLTYNAFQHNNEARNLAFGGELSVVRLPELHFALSDFDSFSGSFRSSDTGNRLSVAGSWTAIYGNTSDRFNAESAYSFNQLQTLSGHVITGYGVGALERVEQHNPFEHEPLLNWTNVFNFNDPITVTETTRRSELYSDLFNGALANQSIQRALANRTVERPPAVIPSPNISIPVSLSAPHLYDDQTVKRPPSVFNPPLEPPRPQPAVIGSGAPPMNSPPQVNGVLMTATVVHKKPTDKVDTSQMFGADDAK